MAPNSLQIRSESWQLIEQQLQKQKPNDSNKVQRRKKNFKTKNLNEALKSLNMSRFAKFF